MRSEAAFAHLAGVAPIPASPGRTHRHRLNRGGDRAANNALHTIVLVRMRYDQRTRAYVERRTKEGLSKRDIMRCLKRFVAREVYRALTSTPTPQITQNDLAPAAYRSIRPRPPDDVGVQPIPCPLLASKRREKPCRVRVLERLVSQVLACMAGMIAGFWQRTVG